MALNKTGLTFVNGTTPAINGTNLNKIVDLTDDLVDYVETRTDLGETTVTQAITSIGTDSVGGKLTADFTGITTVNLLDDDVAGCESTSGWTDSSTTSSVDSSNAFEGTNCIKITNAGYTYRDVLSLMDTTKYYMFSVYAKNGDFSTGVSLRINNAGDAGWIESDVSTSTSYTRLAVLIQPTDFDTATNVYLALRGQGSATEVGYFDAIQLQEITASEYALGASALLTKYPYHRGTADSEAHEVKCVGKNLFDGRLESGNIDSGDGSEVVSTTASRSKNYIRIEPSTQYALKEVASTTLTVREFDINKSFIQTTTLSSDLFTSQANTSYIRLVIGSTDLTSEIQLELGSSATTYEAYKQTIAYTPVLRSVPAIADTFNDDGVKVQNVREYELVAGDITALTTTNTNNDSVSITKSLTGYKYEGSAVAAIEGSFILGQYPEDTRISGFDDADIIGKVASRGSSSSFLVYVANGTYADLAAAKTALAGTKIIYQLATPITTQHDPLTLTAFENGTVYVEPNTNDFTSTIPTMAYNYPTNTAGHTKDNSYGLGKLDAKISDNLEKQFYFNLYGVRW
jgi:hypothetical protein